MPFKHLSSILQEVAGQRPAWRNKMAWGVIWDAWEEIVGPNVVQHAYPEKIVDQGILVVCVADSMWMHHLFLERFNILQAINKRLPKGYALKDMRFKQGVPSSLTLARPQDLRKKASHYIMPKKIPEEIAREAASITSSIKDEKLREVLTRAYIAYRLRSNALNQP